MKKIKHWFDNLLSLLYFGETLDEKRIRDRNYFEAKLVRNYHKKFGTNKLPFDINKLSLRGIIDFEIALTREDFDVNRAVHDINYGVYELIMKTLGTKKFGSFKCFKYYQKINNN